MGFISIVSFIHKKNLVLLSHIYNFFEKGYKFQGSEMSLGLFQDFIDGYIKFLRLPPLLVQLRVPIRGNLTQQGPNQWDN